MINLLAACLILVSAVPLPPVGDTIVIHDWLLVGPFSVGAREGIAGAVEDPATFRPTEGQEFRSSLVQGGVVKCRKVEADSLGQIETNYQDVRWDTIDQYYGNSGIISIGYAYAEFSSPRRSRALAVTPRLGGFTLNGLGYAGDVYGNGWFLTPVELDSGINRVLLRISGYGDEQVRFFLVPPAAPVLPIAADATVPDLVSDSALTASIAVPLLNTTDVRIDSVLLRLDFAATTIETTVGNLPAYGARKVPLRLSFPPQHYDSARPFFAVAVTATALGSSATDTVKLAVRTTASPRRQTFISRIDSSVQYYATWYPQDYDPSRRYPLIYTLHGAGVEAWGQANAYRQKDWAFVVAPTNRRQYGFDWQDWGRLDAAEALDTVLKRLPIDPDRVLLTGGSMGGHGDWHVGLTSPDRFAVVAPQASWPTQQLYVPWFLQRSAIFAQPGQLAIRDAVLRSDNVPAMLGNALNLPYFILHGGDDDNVPPLHGRNFALWLDELGQQYVYREVPGRKHWWSDDSLGITVCDDTALMSYIRDRRRVAGPRHVRFRSGDLGTAHKAYWCDIERATAVGQDAAIEAWADDSLIRVTTENIEQFSLELIGEPFFSGRVAFDVDGRRVGKSSDLPGRVTFHRAGVSWAIGPARTGKPAKTPGLYGPARQAMMSPFILVYGTRDRALAGFLRHTATQEAMRWWLIANGCAEVLPDTEVTTAQMKRYNLVLFGGPAENSVTAKVGSGLPVQVRNGHAFLGKRDLGANLAATCVYPSPGNPNRLVYVRMGTGPEETRLAGFFGLVFSGAGVPDFMVFDRTVRRYGWAGVHAAGFFNADWQLDDRSAFVE